MTGYEVRTNFVYKELTRNLEIGNTPIRVLPNIWRLEQVTDIKFGTNVFDEMYGILLNTAKCQDCGFQRFWIINRKAIGDWWGGKGGE